MGVERSEGGTAPATTPSTTLWTLPNALSALRLVGVPIFIWAILTRHDGIALATLVASGITDYLDGTIARRYGSVSAVGQFLDPLADRLYTVSTVLGFAARGIVPWWLVAVLFARDAVLTIVLLIARRHGQIGLPVNFVGKAATFNLMMAFPALLMAAGDGALAAFMQPVSWALFWWGTGLYWLAGILYAVQLRHLIAAPPATSSTAGPS